MMTKTFLCKATAMFVVLGMTGSVALAQAADPVKGKQTFARCGICHSVVAGENRIGPSLAGVVGRRSGSIANFNYSPAMKASHLTWTPAELDTYLTKPSIKVPGTKMIFAGLTSPADRANVITYLTTLK